MIIQISHINLINQLKTIHSFFTYHPLKKKILYPPLNGSNDIQGRPTVYSWAGPLAYISMCVLRMSCALKIFNSYKVGW